MSKIRSKNTGPEVFIRSALFRLGYRYRINRKDLPGKPDIVLPKKESGNFCSRMLLAPTRRLFPSCFTQIKRRLLAHKTFKEQSPRL
ncbi:hypothetical protein [Parasutterella excrementihominis]|uniref:hypothetical protein n=1 Tax=Parasutterella excrementihominis TaxID=487175 RepID=UPI003AB353CB